MRPRVRPALRARVVVACIAVAVVALPPPTAHAALPVALLAKQMLHQIVKDQLRSAIEGALRGALHQATGDACGLDGGVFAGMPAGGLPAMNALPAMPGMPSLPGLGALQGIGSIAGLSALPGVGALPGAAMLQDVARLMSAVSRADAVGQRLAGGAGATMPSPAEIARMLDAAPMSAEQRAEAKAGLAELQRMQVETRPATPAELKAVLAEAQELGLLEADALGELSGCIASPAAAPVLGMIVPGLREAVGEARRTRDRLAATPPEHRDAVVTEMVEELRAMDVDDREEALQAMARPSPVFPDWLRAGVQAAAP